jgi:hypothetical protein
MNYPDKLERLLSFKKSIHKALLMGVGSGILANRYFECS